MNKKRIPQVLIGGRYVETGYVEVRDPIKGTKHLPIMRDLKLRLENEKQKRKTAERHKRKALEREETT